MSLMADMCHNHTVSFSPSFKLRFLKYVLSSLYKWFKYWFFFFLKAQLLSIMFQGDFYLHNNCECLHSSDQDDPSCLFNRVALAQPFRHLHFIVVILCWTLLLLFLFCFCLCVFFETFFAQDGLKFVANLMPQPSEDYRHELPYFVWVYFFLEVVLCFACFFYLGPELLLLFTDFIDKRT